VAQADPSYGIYKVGSIVFKNGLWSANLPENCHGDASCNKVKAARAFFIMATIAACKWNRISANRTLILPSCL